MSSEKNGPVNIPETDEEWDELIEQADVDAHLAQQQKLEEEMQSGFTKPTEPNPSVNPHSTDPNAPLPEGVKKRVMGMAIPTREKQLEDYEKYVDIRYHKDYRRSMTYEINGEKKLRWI